MNKCFILEFKKFVSLDRIILIIVIFLITLALQFSIVKEGYTFYNSKEVFEEAISGLIPMLFPILTVILYSNNYYLEKKNHYLTYVRSRILIKEYIVCKGIFNSIVTFFLFSLFIILIFIFFYYIEPILGVIKYKEKAIAITQKPNTLSFLFEVSSTFYILVYSIWISLNAAIYSTIAFLLTILINNQFIALSIPLIIYHIGNFVMAFFGLERFSPLISIFPFSVTRLPLWNIVVPFMILLGLIVILIAIIQVKLKNGDSLD